MSEPYLTDLELASEFRQAKEPRAYIKIAADLSMCSPREIAQRLDDMDELRKYNLTPEMFSSRFTPVAAAKKPNNRAPKHPRVVMDEIRAMELYEDGSDDLAMPAQPPEQAEHSQTATAAGEPAAAPEAPLMTLGEFLRTVTELTPSAALKAPLWINGVAVGDVAQIIIKGGRCAEPYVDIVTEG